MSDTPIPLATLNQEMSISDLSLNESIALAFKLQVGTCQNLSLMTNQLSRVEGALDSVMREANIRVGEVNDRLTNLENQVIAVQANQVRGF